MLLYQKCPHLGERESFPGYNEPICNYQGKPTKITSCEGCAHAYYNRILLESGRGDEDLDARHLEIGTNFLIWQVPKEQTEQYISELQDYLDERFKHSNVLCVLLRKDEALLEFSDEKLRGIGLQRVKKLDEDLEQVGLQRIPEGTKRSVKKWAGETEWRIEEGEQKWNKTRP
jgi:hypothetical protein